MQEISRRVTPPRGSPRVRRDDSCMWPDDTRRRCEGADAAAMGSASLTRAARSSVRPLMHAVRPSMRGRRPYPRRRTCPLTPHVTVGATAARATRGTGSARCRSLAAAASHAAARRVDRSGRNRLGPAAQHRGPARWRVGSGTGRGWPSSAAEPPRHSVIRGGCSAPNEVLHRTRHRTERRAGSATA